MAEVRCPYCHIVLVRFLKGTVEVFCRRCKRRIVLSSEDAA